MTHIHWVPRGTRTPNDKDEVNKREVSECDVCVCDLEVGAIGDPSIFNVIHSDAALARMLPTLICLLRIVKTRATDKTYI